MDNRKAMLIQLAGAVFVVLVAIVVVIKQRMLMLEECEESGDSDIDIRGRRTDEEATDHEDYASDGHSRPSASQSSQKRPAVSQSSNMSSRKVKRLKEDGTMTQLSEKVRKVAEAIKSINVNWHVKVHDALWAFEEYPSDMLDQANRFLEKDEFGMKSFALKDEELKNKWLDAFKEKNYLPDGDESDDF